MSNPRCDWVWWNGSYKRWEDSQIHVGAHALHYGSSVFEGLRAYETPAGPAVLGLQPHLQRLLNSCKVARMPITYNQDQLSQAVLELVERNQHRSCYIRPLVFKGYGGFRLDPRSYPTEVVLFTWEWAQYLGSTALEEGVNVCVSSWRRAAPDTVPVLAKIGGNYVGAQLATMEAIDNGYDEGICLDVNGYVSEGTSENLFLVRDGVLYTPPLAASILGGVNRSCVLTLARSLGIEVKEEMLAREMLYSADEIFFTGTAAEITPVRSVDRLPVGQGQRGPLTGTLQEHFFGIVSGRLPDRFGWMTPVASQRPTSGKENGYAYHRI